MPSRAVSKVGAREGRNLTCCIADEVRREHISYHHVAIGMELLAVMVVDPLTDRRIPSVYRESRTVRAGICNLFSRQVS